MSASAGLPSTTSSATDGRQVIGTFTSYADAQRAVDRLSDREFPVEHTEIVGLDLRLVEQVTGRLTKGRAALAGAGSGAWFGLFFGLVIGLFTTGPEWLGLILGAVIVGALWGAVFGFLTHAATGGHRDFASASGIVAGRYEVTVADPHADQARQLLAAAGAPRPQS